VVTPRGEVVIVEAALAAAIEARTPRFDGYDPRADIAQIARAGLSLMLGRPMAADCDAEERDRLLAEAADVAAIRVNGPFSAALRSWFEQALAIDTTPFSDFQEAADAFASVTAAREDGSSALRRTLQAFLSEVDDVNPLE